MKHPHASLIKQWLEDTTQEIEAYCSTPSENCWIESKISQLIMDKNKLYQFRIKPKPDELLGLKFKETSEQTYTYKKPYQYEHLRQAIRDGKKIEYICPLTNTWTMWIMNTTDGLFELNVNNYRIHDLYRELKEAQASGKRVVYQKSNDDWIDLPINYLTWSLPLERYKIVEHDKESIIYNDVYVSNNKFRLVKIKITVSGITGKITAEIINE